MLLILSNFFSFFKNVFKSFKFVLIMVFIGPQWARINELWPKTKFSKNEGSTIFWYLEWILFIIRMILEWYYYLLLELLLLEWILKNVKWQIHIFQIQNDRFNRLMIFLKIEWIFLKLVSMRFLIIFYAIIFKGFGMTGLTWWIIFFNWFDLLKM